MSNALFLYNIACIVLFSIASTINYGYPCLRWKKEITWTPASGYVLAVIIVTTASIICTSIDIGLIISNGVAHREVLVTLAALAVIVVILSCLGMLKACTEPPPVDAG